MPSSPKVNNLEHKLAGSVREERQKFKSMISSVRQRVNTSEVFEPTHAVAVILHDMKEMLEAVPHMANNMSQMTVDMHEMNMKMGVMAYGVDSTMGRAGRMMP